MESALFELDTMGILRATKLPAKLEWLNELEITVLLLTLAAGEDGLSRRRVKKMADAGADAVRRLELRDLIKWEHDRFGREAFLTLTWQGDEAAKTLLAVGKHKSMPSTDVSQP